MPVSVSKVSSLFTKLHHITFDEFTRAKDETGPQRDTTKRKDIQTVCWQMFAAGNDYNQDGTRRALTK